MIRFVLHPGLVPSANDGDHNYVGAPMLAHLYGVPLKECIVIRDDQDLRGQDLDAYLHLYPKRYGYIRVTAQERLAYPLSGHICPLKLLKETDMTAKELGSGH